MIPMPYICRNNGTNHSKYINTHRRVCTKCESLKKKGRLNGRFGLLRYCSRCNSYANSKNFTRNHACYTRVITTKQKNNEVEKTQTTEHKCVDKKFDYLNGFIRHVKSEVAAKGVVPWHKFSDQYKQLIRNPIWNTTLVRNTLEKYKLLGDDFRFMKEEELYYIISCNDYHSLFTGCKRLFTTTTTRNINTTSAPSMDTSNLTRASSKQLPSDIEESRDVSSQLSRICPGFKPNAEALEWCSILNCLVLTTGIVAIQNDDEMMFRSIHCMFVLSGREQHCRFCSIAKKLLDQRGVRAAEAVKCGSIQGRNMSSTNTIALLRAKISQLQKTIYHANTTIRLKQKEIDQMFDHNVEAQKEAPNDLQRKKELFIKLCKALHICEGFPFFFELIENQLENYLKVTPYLHRYSDRVKHFWKHFRHNTGPKAIDILRGVSTKDGRFHYNMIVPCNRSLDKVEDIGSYGGPNLLRVTEILSSLEQHTRICGCKDYIISFDGIIVIPRYKYNEGLDLVLGGTDALTPEEYSFKSKEELDDALGNEVLQFVLQSLDGAVTIRVGHWVKPDKCNTTRFIIAKLKFLVDIFYKKGVCEIIGSCSDGDLATDAVQYMMELYTRSKFNTPWFHSYDFSHVLKAPRNALLNRVLEPRTQKLHMNILISLCSKTGANTLNFIQDSWLNPPDIMKMTPCLELTSNRVQEALKNLPDVYSEVEKTTAKEFSEYFMQIRKLYDCFMNSSITQDDALRQLYGKACTEEPLAEGNLLSYITSWNSTGRKKLAPQTSRHITTTIFQLKKLTDYLKSTEVKYVLKRSVLSTLSVELGFCVTRGMQSYVTASEYSTLSGRTEWQQRIMCTDIKSRGFSLPSDIKEPSKYYNACVVHYSEMPDLKMKRDSVEKRQRHSDECLKSMREKLASQGESTGHKKVRSHCNTSHKQMWFKCDIINCQHLPFHYPAALESHLIRVHNLSSTDASQRVTSLKATMMEKMLNERSIARKNFLNRKSESEILTEDEEQSPSEDILDLETCIHTCHDEPDELNTTDPIRYAKGDDIFPISYELLGYIEDLEDTFGFTQVELSSTNTDCSQSEFNLEEKKPILVSFCDCETINLEKWPKGCPCEIAVTVQGMSDILCSRMNPCPHFSEDDWSTKSIEIHGITPEDVKGQPLLENVLEAFYRLVTVNNRCRAIIVAYNAPFDNSRITSCAEGLVKNFNQYNVLWVDARKLLGEEFITDDDGRVIDQTGKLSELFHYRFKDKEPIDLNLIHGARYDTYMLKQLLLQKYDTEEKLREVIIEMSSKRKGDECRCITGCTNCSCAVEGVSGCTDNCKCFGCQNPIRSKPSAPLPFEFKKLTQSGLNTLSMYQLQLFLWHKNADLRGTKLELVTRLSKIISGDDIISESPKNRGRKKNNVSLGVELTRDLIVGMSKKQLILHLKKRYKVNEKMSSYIGLLQYKLLEVSGKLDSEDEQLKVAKKYKKGSNKKNRSTPGMLPNKKQKKTNKRTMIQASNIDQDNVPDDSQLPPKKRMKN